MEPTAEYLGSIAVNFSEAINNNEQIKFLKANGLIIQVFLSVVGDKSADNGYISISVEAERA